MTMIRVALLVGVVAGCGDDATPSIDAPPVAMADAPTPTVDAEPAAPDAEPATPDAAAGAPDGGGGGTPFVVNGTVVGPGAAAGAVEPAWLVSSTSPDYAYIYGEGSSVGATFTATIPGDPPVVARNTGPGFDVGISILVLMPPGQDLPEGMVMGDPPIVGASARHAIIWRGPDDDGSIVSWTTLFPFGFSCGVCVDSPMGFDTYEPVDCSEVVIDTDPAANFCNFT